MTEPTRPAGDAEQQAERDREERAVRRRAQQRAADEARAVYASPPDSVGPTDVPAADGGPDARQRMEKTMAAAGFEPARRIGAGTENEPHCDEPPPDGADGSDDASARAAATRQAGTTQAATVTGRKATPPKASST